MTASRLPPRVPEWLCRPDHPIAKQRHGHSDADLIGTVSYQNMSGARYQQVLQDILLHLFNHQAHHRGHAHACCSIVTGEEPPPLDLVRFSAACPHPDLAHQTA
jgi:uncharacterized damage-inducible protein DinB